MKKDRNTQIPDDKERNLSNRRTFLETGRRILILFFLISPGLLLTTSIGCGEDPPGDGLLVVELTGDNTKAEDISRLLVNLSRVEILHSATQTGEAKKRTVEAKPHPLDFSFAQGHIAISTYTFFVSPGFVHQIRLITRDGQVFTTEGQVAPKSKASGKSNAGKEKSQNPPSSSSGSLKIPSGPQTGIKIEPPSGVLYPIQTDKVTRVGVRLNLRDVLNRPPGIGFLLKPTHEGQLVDTAKEVPSVLAPGQVFVMFKKGTTKTTIDQVLARHNAKAIRTHPTLPWVTVQLPQSGGEIAAATAFEAESSVAVTMLNYRMVPTKTPTEWSGGNQRQDYLEKIRAPEGWDLTTGSRRVLVAVIDTGFNPYHPELQENLVFNQAEIPTQRTVNENCFPQVATNLPKITDANGDTVITLADFNHPTHRADWLKAAGKDPADPNAHVMMQDLIKHELPLGGGNKCGLLEDNQDNDGNGLVDDLVGWDFVGNGDKVIRDRPHPQPGVDEKLFCHGNTVAAIIGAVEKSESIFKNDANSQKLNIVGVNWQVSMILLRAFTNVATESPTFFDSIAFAMRYAVERGAHIVNMSLGTLCAAPSAPIEQVVRDRIGCEEPATFRSRWSKFMQELDGSKVLFVTGATNERYDADDDRILALAAESGAPNQIAVTFVQPDLSWEDGSNERIRTPWGKKTFEIAAPGVMLPALGLQGPDSSFNGVGRVPTSPDKEATSTGTSFAAPQVAGTAALLLALNWARFHNNPTELKRVILDSAKKVDALKNKVSEGRILDVQAALQAGKP